jgi:IclR family transcriptional regulator, KDG regulon repressor
MACISARIIFTYVKALRVSTAAIKSARRVFEILELFDRERRPLTLAEICRAFGYAPSSGSALLKSMVTLGYLEYDKASRSYFPTMRIAALGAWVRDSLFGDGEISRLMTRLRRATRETIILATQSDLFAQYVHLLHGAHPLHVAVQPGARRPLATSGMGWLFLSTHTDKEIEVLRRRINAQPGGAQRFTRDEIMRQVNTVRVAGYAFSKGAVAKETGLIGMVLPKGLYGRTFAIGVAGALNRLERREAEIVAELQAAIARMD